MKFNERGELILDSEENRRWEHLRANYDESELLALMLVKKVI